MNETDPSSAKPTLEAYERRVLGVLVEKAKTTPAAYPLSLNALRTGCNQKSNRFPQVELDEEQVERVVDSLREKGAVTVVQGDSRVERYRHRAYEWLGVEKAELAVLAELLLRGAQTVGELRGRAARMEPIKSLVELTPVLDALVEKGLVSYLSPPGRGAVVSHTFFSDGEMERVRRDLGISADGAVSPPPAATTPAPPAEVSDEAAAPSATADWRSEVAALRVELSEEIGQLRDEVAELRRRLEG